jgi:hypothetical protein
LAATCAAVVSGRWLVTDRNAKRLTQGRVPIGVEVPRLRDGCQLFMKIRRSDGGLGTDMEHPVLQASGAESFIASKALSEELRDHPLGDGEFALIVFEGTGDTARCIFRRVTEGFFADLAVDEPTINLASYDVPPAAGALLDGGDALRAIVSRATQADPVLFAPQAARFLDGPHILEQLLVHLMELHADEAPRFVTVTKGIADQLRSLLANPSSPVTIERVPHSHVDVWAEFDGKRIAFVDGGAARLTSVPGVEPAAMRVGVYSVTPGETTLPDREAFQMDTRLIADMVQATDPAGDEPDRKRLQEAARYVLELLVMHTHAEGPSDIAVSYLHGPLVNQFVAYDHLEPNRLPAMSHEFLRAFEIEESTVTGAVADLPTYDSGRPMWDQFMAVYGLLLKQVEQSRIPLVGVVERSTGHPVLTAILKQLERRHIVRETYSREVLRLIQKYRLTDSLVLGCLLDQGEYLSPTPISKNNERQAHDEWKPVVRAYMSPFATYLKTSMSMPPFRIEMNESAMSQTSSMASLTYHTARLLPEYAFPVGLDIVDKFAKVPDWIARGVSSSLAASVMKRAVADGDPKVIAQVSRFLAGEPRDFFYRPSSR